MIMQLASKFTKRYGNHWVSKEQYLQKVGCPYRRINLKYWRRTIANIQYISWAIQKRLTSMLAIPAPTPELGTWP